MTRQQDVLNSIAAQQARHRTDGTSAPGGPLIVAPPPDAERGLVPNPAQGASGMGPPPVVEPRIVPGAHEHDIVRSIGRKQKDHYASDAAPYRFTRRR